jgi:hypothetical protein
MIDLIDFNQTVFRLGDVEIWANTCHQRKCAVITGHPFSLAGEARVPLSVQAGAQPHSPWSLWLNYMDYDHNIVQQLLLEGADGAGVSDDNEFDLERSGLAGGVSPLMTARISCIK